ncbi:excinuclease ABC subunit UvrA [Candidatus Sumerlaeota bacterium]|nr:excinuclease ABC subunit UvrA [Candidatus Sumerlaeota bacterium]
MTKKKPSAPPPEADQVSIIIRGARTHNLKNVSCCIPAEKLTVITGVSGSGKSSLAFDTLFAEGQRRYVESLSTYARQFIARMPRPDVDEIDNIPPAIAMEQKNPVRNARSTIGTATEINDHLRLLFAKIGRVICPRTNLEVNSDSPERIVQFLLTEMDGERLYIIAPVKVEKKSLLKGILGELQRQGFTRIVLDKEIVEIDQPDFKAPAALPEILVVIDRLAISAADRSRITEAVEAAYRVGSGRCIIHTREGKQRHFSEQMRCAECPGDCGQTFRLPTIQSLNFSSPLGACPTCQGFGRVTGIDWGKVIPDPRLSLEQNAIAPWKGETGGECLRDLKKMSSALGIRMNVAWEDLTAREQELVRLGDRGKWYGIKGFFDWLEERRYKMQARIMIARYRGYTDCPDCQGFRLKQDALMVRIKGLHIGQVCAMSVKDLIAWFKDLNPVGEEKEIAERPLEEILSRLHFLDQVGLSYMTLARQTRTLSGGESQRINLSTALGSALTETLYVLDEPTVGLHARDTDRLIGVLKHLRGLGNTVVVVEHDLDVIREADHLIDIGPEAGEKGGMIIYEGSPAKLAADGSDSRTARYLRAQADHETLTGPERKSSARSRFGRRSPTGWITINGARENNLKSVTARIPLGVLCCVTGVSGSGKSSLIKTCFHQNYLREYKADSSAEPGDILSIDGINLVDEIVMVDQSPIGRSSRSNAATYLKAYDEIRNLLAKTPEAEALALKPKDFSFNVAGGRCETCEGTGRQVIDMHFLADVEVLCEQCDGQRFQDRILDIQWKGMNVSTILNLTVNEACHVFSDYPKVLRGLLPLAKVGLGYLRLGQSTATLSGGEAQRLKLAAHLAGLGASKNSLLLFDEPTTGLHAADLDVLMKVFARLLDEGYSLVIIEHNLQLIRRADYIIDLGPEGGEDGGHIVFEGTPEQIISHPESLTGKYLAQYLRKSESFAG